MSKKMWTSANIVTCARVVLVPVWLLLAQLLGRSVAMAATEGGVSIGAFAVFLSYVVISLTDKLDGYLAAAGLSRDDIFITNVVKCRPPSNRNPRPEEIEACAPYLRNQVRAIWPDAIVCLGNFASQFILRTEKGVTSLRGRLYQTGHFVVLPTFHPAATIYHPAWEPLLTDDLRLLGQWLREHPKGQETSQGQEISADQAFSQGQEASHE